MSATQPLELELRDTIALLRSKADELGNWREADGLAREEFNRLNKRIDELQDALREHEKRMRTPNGASEDKQEASVMNAAFAKYLRRGEQRLNATEVAALESHQKALSVDSDPDGGYAVTPEMSARIIEVVRESSPVRQVATVETIGTDALEGMFDGDEAGAAWVAERGSRAVTDTPQLGMWRIPTHELYAAPRATQKLLDDANFNVEAWLNRKVAERFARLESTAFVSGSGSGRPRGFTTYADGTTRGTIERVNSGDGTHMLPSAVFNVVTALKSPYRAGAVWAMNRGTVGYIRTMRDESGGAGTGQFLWQPGLQASEPDRLIGFPILEMEDLQDLGTGSNLPIAFGNFRDAYTIVDRVGIRVLRDPYSNKPYVEFYTTKRVGGDVVNFEALKLMVVSA